MNLSIIFYEFGVYSRPMHKTAQNPPSRQSTLQFENIYLMKTTTNNYQLSPFPRKFDWFFFFSNLEFLSFSFFFAHHVLRVVCFGLVFSSLPFFSFYSVFRLILFVFVCFFICVRACAACCPITVDPPPDTQPCKFLPAKKKQTKQNKTKQNFYVLFPGEGNLILEKKNLVQNI